MEFFIIFIFFVALMIASHFIAAYAERKGRSYFGFWVLTFMCFPLGLVAAVLASTNQEKMAVISSLEKCEFCAEYIKREAKICRFCQKEHIAKPQEETTHLSAVETLIDYFANTSK